MNPRTHEAGRKSVVLVGIDFSTLAPELLATAANFADSAGSELHVVHVLKASGDGASPGDGVLRFASLATDVRARLALLAKDVPASVNRIDLHVRVGRPDVEIAQLASDVGADLVVVGTHDHSALDRLTLGSVAESLVRHARCPVLTHRSRSTPAWEQVAPPCAACLAVQRRTGRSRLWCDRHGQHHARRHTYSEIPPTYGLGSQTFR
jgi:nucleotide-binding universal stress UspA family protein